MKKGLKLLGIAVGVAAIMALSLSGTVFADTSEETETTAFCGGYGFGGFHGEEAACSEVLGELLGLTPEALCELRQAGQSLVEIAAANGVSAEALTEAIMAEKTATVQARVAEGTLTQEQADLMLQQMTQRTEQAINRTATGPAEWRMGHGRGMSGEGAGTGLANRWGGQRGACYGEADGSAVPGGMSRWGRSAR
ncbi:hypothetical protein ACFLW1_02745 [Chloroflexota bacterium]